MVLPPPWRPGRFTKAVCSAWAWTTARFRPWPTCRPCKGAPCTCWTLPLRPNCCAPIEAQAAKLVLLDHHKSAADQLDGFACRCGVVFFDMHKSGARLAWEFFHPQTPLPDLVRYVEDRDLWNWQFPESAAYLAALDMEPQDFARWQALAAFDAAQNATFMARGEAMDEKFRKLASDMAEGAQPLRFNGQEGLMLNAPSAFHSLLGELLSKQCGSFALLWSAGKGGVVKVGLRSQRGYDCIPLAHSMGGGAMRRPAGSACLSAVCRNC